MNGFIELLTKLVIEAGIGASHIYYRDSLELPGYFRPSKRWDFLVVVKNQLVMASVTMRLISSGMVQSPERMPPSTCATGTWSF